MENAPPGKVAGNEAIFIQFHLCAWVKRVGGLRAQGSGNTHTQWREALLFSWGAMETLKK